MISWFLRILPKVFQSFSLSPNLQPTVFRSWFIPWPLTMHPIVAKSGTRACGTILVDSFLAVLAMVYYCILSPSMGTQVSFINMALFHPYFWGFKTFIFPWVVGAQGLKLTFRTWCYRGNPKHQLSGAFQTCVLGVGYHQLKLWFIVLHER